VTVAYSINRAASLAGMPTFTPRAAAVGLVTEMMPSCQVLKPSPIRADIVDTAAAGTPRSPKIATPSTAVLFLPIPASLAIAGPDAAVGGFLNHNRGFLSGKGRRDGFAGWRQGKAHGGLVGDLAGHHTESARQGIRATDLPQEPVAGTRRDQGLPKLACTKFPH
jgi:hypothetical protein